MSTQRIGRPSLTTRAAHAFAAYRNGDTPAMRALIDIASPTLWHLARSCGLDRTAAEDVVQTAWLKLLENAEAIHDSAAILGWLCVTTKREAWRVAKLAKADRPVADPEPPLPEATPHNPEAIAELHDEARALWHHFAALSPRCQQLLRVISQGGPPDYAALSTALGIPIGSIGPTRGRCLAKLRATLLNDPHWSTP
ncbi:MAG: RNA polymerase sigma factor [Arachnia sp.]